tara:strand:- start:128 stop:877 length:750 start_codon:yes stop_codon:yes gene_type:complete
MNFNFLKILGLLVCLTSLTYSQKGSNLPESMYMNISFSVLQPQGEFANNVTNNGYGVDFDGGWYIYNGPVGLGVNIIAAQYGNFTRQIPYSYFVPLATLTETTQSTIFIINPYVQPTLRMGDFSFYTKLFAGYQGFETNTKIQNDEQANNENDDDEPDYIAQSNVATDGAFDYGVGLGMRFPIFRGGENGPVFICLEMKWSKGGEAEYLNAGKQGSIVLSDPADGPVTATLNPDKSKTDLFNISIGIGF